MHGGHGPGMGMAGKGMHGGHGPGMGMAGKGMHGGPGMGMAGKGMHESHRKLMARIDLLEARMIKTEAMLEMLLQR
jgi:hypothetical protein